MSEPAYRQESDLASSRGPAIPLLAATALSLVLTAIAVEITRCQPGPSGVPPTAGAFGPVMTAPYDPAEVPGPDAFADERRRLHSWGWVDRESGEIHIPIEHAMDILAHREAP